MRLLGIAAAIEAATGLALLASPDLVARLLLGAEAGGTGAALGRFAGAALTCLALASWPKASPGGDAGFGQLALWLFQPVAVACLLFAVFGAGLQGVLLWPAIAYHAAATMLLGRVALGGRPGIGT